MEQSYRDPVTRPLEPWRLPGVIEALVQVQNALRHRRDNPRCPGPCCRGLRTDN